MYALMVHFYLVVIFVRLFDVDRYIILSMTYA